MSGDDRRSFSSRTPANDNPERVTYRRGFITRHQVTGWRFVMRRIASGLALHDTRMLVDPLRSQSRAVMMGVLLAVTAVVGCFVFSMLRPGGVPGSDPVLADRATSALYVRLGDRLHPVLNLTSARLAVGARWIPPPSPASSWTRSPAAASSASRVHRNGWCRTRLVTPTGQCVTAPAEPQTLPV